MNFAYLALWEEGRLPDYSFHRGHAFNIEDISSYVGSPGWRKCNYDF